MATHTRTQTIVDEYKGEFAGAHTIRLGLAGVLTPTSYTATFTNVNGVERAELHLVAINSYNNPMRGDYGFPHPTKLSEHDYGHGGAGFISEVTAGLLDEIETQNGIRFGASRKPLVHTEQKCSNGYTFKCAHVEGKNVCVYCHKPVL